MRNNAKISNVVLFHVDAIITEKGLRMLPINFDRFENNLFYSISYSL